MDILTSIHGKRLGLSKEGFLVTNKPTGEQQILGASADKIITSAQVLALFGTPQTVVAAPGSGLALIFRSAMVYKPAGTAYADVALTEDLVFKYTNAAGQQASAYIEATGFLDQATAQVRHVTAVGSNGTTTAGDITPVDNAALVMHLLVGEITTGTSPLVVRTWYDIIPMTLPTA